MTSPGPRSSQPTARSYSAAAKTTQGLSPLQWGDKCFLCGREIPEGGQQGFYQSRKGGFYRCHRGCLNIMQAQGGHPRDFHAFMEAKHAAPVHDAPVPMDPVAPAAAVPGDLDADELPPNPGVAAEATWNGPRSIKFNDFGHMQQFISQRGPIPKSVRIFVGETCLQAGGG